MLSSILLMAAVLASLAFGVLVAYGVCLGVFAVLRLSAMAKRPVVGAIAVEGQ